MNKKRTHTSTNVLQFQIKKIPSLQWLYECEYYFSTESTSISMVFAPFSQFQSKVWRAINEEWNRNEKKKQSAVSFFFTEYFLQFNMRKWSKLMLSVLFVDVVFFLFVCIYRTIHIKTIWSASSKKQAAFVCLLFEKRVPCSQPLKILKYLRINVFQPVNSTHYMPYIFNEWVDLTKKNQI